MSGWRLGGYEEWLANQEYFSDARAFAERRKFLDSSGISAEDLLGVITARWASIMDTMHEMDIISLNCSIGRWQKLTNSAAILRKLELQKARLDLDRETRQPKGEKKDEEASSSPHSTVPAESISPASDTANSLPSRPASGDTLFCPGVPCHPDELIDLKDGDMTAEEEAWQALWNPPAPPPKPAPVVRPNSPWSRESVPDSRPVAPDSATPRPTSSGSSPYTPALPTLSERIRAALQARIDAGEDDEPASGPAESTDETALAGIHAGVETESTPDFNKMRSKPDSR